MELKLLGVKKKNSRFDLHCLLFGDISGTYANMLTPSHKRGQHDLKEKVLEVPPPPTQVPILKNWPWGKSLNLSEA